MKKIFLFVFIAFSFLCSCVGEPEPLNVVFIGLDTVRSDHLGCYGYERETSPAIDQLASEGTLFEYAVSHSPWTLPSFASAFTSLYPTQHGAGFLESAMGIDFPTLGSVFADHGYMTGAIINTAALNPAFGIDRGFVHYDVVPATHGRVAGGTTVAVLDWIDRQGDAPFFVFAHYYDPHLPFSPPAPFDTLFDPGYIGEIGNSFDPEFLPTDRMNGFEKMNALSGRDKEHIMALYDGEIAFADRAIGDLVKGLGERGLMENTLIVFMSDHGEEFFDHGGFAHGHTLYEELLRVPLIFRLPGRIPAGKRIPGVVRLIDLMPTILNLAGIEIDAHMEGRDLCPLFQGEETAGPPRQDAMLVDEVFSESLLFGPEQKCVTAFPYKIIRHMGSGEEMVFDLDRDPAETRDLTRSVDTALPAGTYQTLEQHLFGTIFRASDTWYIQVDPAGAGHLLDMTASAAGAAGGEINLHRAFDTGGRFLDDSEIGLSHETESRLRLVGLSLDESFILAFKVEPPMAAVEFNFLLDGEAATGITYIGDDLAGPEAMPFTRRGASKNLGKPASHPGAPCFLIWHAGGQCKGRRPVELDRDIKRELRSLGYIQ
jgi:arylsulfatase A-like enzyme